MMPNLDFSIKTTPEEKNIFVELPFWIIKPEINSCLCISEASSFYGHSVWPIPVNQFPVV